MQYTGRQRSTYHLLVNINVIYTICTVHDTFSRATNRIDEKQKSDVSETSQHTYQPEGRLLWLWRRMLEHERVLEPGTTPWLQSLARFLRMHGFHVTAQVAVVTVDAATHGTRPGSLPGHTLHSQPTREHAATHRYCNSTTSATLA